MGKRRKEEGNIEKLIRGKGRKEKMDKRKQCIKGKNGR
jgi:hypothetical protein